MILLRHSTSADETGMAIPEAWIGVITKNQ
jgi:hypothetical protein